MARARLSKDYQTVLEKELRLIHSELVDGCTDCHSKYNMCVKHRMFLATVVNKPAKYIELKCVDGEVRSKRLFDIETV